MNRLIAWYCTRPDHQRARSPEDSGLVTLNEREWAFCLFDHTLTDPSEHTFVRIEPITLAELRFRHRAHD